MKRLIPIPLWIFLALGPVKGQDTLLLFHPTTASLQILENLVGRGILPLENFHIVGVYHASGIYDYGLTGAYIRERGLDWISLQEVSARVMPGELFRENGFTDSFRRLFSGSCGAFFMGGPDIPPQVYNENTSLLTLVTDPHRHYLEASFLFHLLGGYQAPDWEPYLEHRPEYVVSGICLGMQTMNVATGGTLVQDIPTELYGVHTVEEILALPADHRHRNYQDLVPGDCSEPTSYHFHRIRIPEGSFLNFGTGQVRGEGPLVLSSHHQAVEIPGRDLRVAALSSDGKVIEAVSHQRFPHVIGVQFHPEKQGLYDPGIPDPLNCTDSISFHAEIRESPSYDFHLAYWKYIGQILSR